MDFANYIVDNALILIPVLLILGKMFKAIPNFPDWCIPWALLIAGVMGACFMMGWQVDAFIQGVLVAGAAVYGHQLWKQTTGNRVDDGEQT